MKEALGAMFAAGHDLTILDRYSWAQIGLMAECLGLHHSRMFDTLFTPIAAMMGHKYKPQAGPKSAAKKPTSVDYSDPAAVQRAKERDARILIGAGALDGAKIDL